MTPSPAWPTARTRCAIARIQAAYDLKNMGFEAFSIDAYSKNDVSAAPELELRPGAPRAA